jgi:hypothetical protein
MTRDGRAKVTDWLAWGVSRLGWPGLAGLGMLALTAMAWVTLLDPLEDQLRADQARADRLARRPPPMLQAAVERDWRADLPAGHAGHAQLARLFAAARESGLRLAEGRYQESRDAGSGVTRLAISLPVSGRYPAIRAFVAHALTRQPGLALESLRLSREHLGDKEIQADLRFVLLMGTKP